MKQKFLLLVIAMLIAIPCRLSAAITVYLQKPSWSTVYFYAWLSDMNETQLLGAWPGTAMTETVSYDGKQWYSYTFPEQYTDINIIFNSGMDGAQTVDVRNVTETVYFRLNGESGKQITVTDVYGDFEGGSHANAWPEQYAGVMLQGFYWDSFNDTNWKNLTASATELSSYFDLIWVPNSAKAASNPGMGYDPVYWMSNHNSSFGSESELREMIKTYKELGTGIIEDVVVNHRSGATNWTDFPTETYKGVTYEWGPWAICSTDEVKDAAGQERPTGAADTGDDFNGSRDLDHTNSKVRAGIKAYLDYLKNDLGYVGWRYDMVKGYSANYVGEYNKAAGAEFSVGEYWDGYDNITNWIQGTGMNSAAFDFPFKYAVNDAFHGNDFSKLCWKRNGSLDQPAGLIHMDTYTRYAVTFIDNHDTYRNESKMNGDVVAANAYMLSMPGTPCVFLRHWLDHKAEIGQLIDIRKAVGVHNQSEVKVLRADKGCFCAEVTGKNGKLAVKIGPEMYTPAGYSDNQLKASGNGYAVWTSVDIVKPEVTMSPEPGVYEGGTKVTLDVKGIDDVDKAVIIYTLDGSVPTIDNGEQVKPGFTLNITEKTVIKAVVAMNGSVVSRVYEGEYRTEIKPITVYLEQPAWSTVNFYSWDENGDRLIGDWPGMSITDTKQLNGKTWYYHTFPVEYTMINIIFNNGTDQTVDITNVTDDVYYRLNGTSGKTITVTDVTDEMTSGIEDIVSFEAVYVYPNPVAETLNVNSSEVKTVEVYSIGGSRVMYGNETNTLDVSGLCSGMYLYNIVLDNGDVVRGKFVKK